MASHPRSVFQALLSRVLAIRESSDAIEEAFNDHSSQSEGSGELPWSVHVVMQYDKVLYIFVCWQLS